MSPTTHCDPNGFLGTAELPVPNISGATVTTFNPPSGLRRGVVIYMHGLYGTAQSAPIPPSTASGGMVGDNANALGSLMGNTICTNLAYDGWVVLAIPAQEDNYANIPMGGVYNDIAADTGLGLRYQASTLRTFDHARQYVLQTYGNWPIVVGGQSLGAWRALTVANLRASQIVAYFAHQSLTVWETLGTGYTPGFNFGQLVTLNGTDLSSTWLNAVTVPGFASYGTADSAVWWGGASTTTLINGGAGAVAAGSVTNLTVGGGSLNFWTATGGVVTLEGLSGGSSNGTATYSYTGFNAGTGVFSGMVLQGGSGNVVVGCTVQQSYIDSMLTNGAGAGRPITRNSTAQNHSFGITDTGAYYAGTTTTINALNALTTLQMTATQASCQALVNQGLISTKCAIQDSTGLWYVITFGGVASPNLTGVSISTTAIGGGGSGAATINAGAPICNIGTAITGGFSNQSIPYWMSTVVDPSYPKTY